MHPSTLASTDNPMTPHPTTRNKSMPKSGRWARLALMVALAVGMTPIWALNESRKDRDASGLREALAEDSSNGYRWSDIGEAFDRASVAWMTVYGDRAILAVRPGVATGVRAMKEMGWIGAKTHVVISILDARGDFAEGTSDGCRAQVNVDEDGSSPVIRALGGKSSSLSFLVAHELVHCRFDALDNDGKLPSVAMLREMGISSSLSTRLLGMMRDPKSADGSAALLDAYDEALADAAAAIALVRLEAGSERVHFGTALQHAQSLRFGLLQQSLRRKTAAEAHQGAFVFDEILEAQPQTLTWDVAKRLAFRSVLMSSLSMDVSPRWWQSLAALDPRGTKALQKVSRAGSKVQLSERNLDLDEDLFLTARSPAFIAITTPDVTLPAPKDPTARWKEVGWIDPLSPTFERLN